MSNKPRVWLIRDGDSGLFWRDFGEGYTSGPDVGLFTEEEAKAREGPSYGSRHDTAVPLSNYRKHVERMARELGLLPVVAPTCATCREQNQQPREPGCANGACDKPTPGQPSAERCTTCGWPVGEHKKKRSDVMLGPLVVRVWTPQEACAGDSPFEYDQGDVVLVHYNDLYNLVFPRATMDRGA